MHPTQKMPVLFVGHGSPMNALEHNAATQSWETLARELPRPQAILCISAHWESNGTRVSVTPQPRTIHDFYGFPKELFEMRYPAPGAPAWAEKTRALIHTTPVAADADWGLDHGAWSVLCCMFPNANIPVFQLSLDRTKSPKQHYALGRELAPLREQGVLIMGSGNIVHNLRLMEQRDAPFDWAQAFDTKVKELILARDHDALIHYNALGKEAQLSIPTNEHYLPLLYALSLQGDDETVQFFAEHFAFGSLSMRGVRIG